MSRITDIAKTMKTWWNEDDDPYVHRALDEIIRIDQEQAPTIEPKQGEWIEVQISEQFKRMVCSECGNSYVTDMITPLEAWIDNRHRFCPNCGADMRGTDDEASD